MAQQFYHLQDVKNLCVVSDDEGGYMLRVTLNEGAKSCEPAGLIDNFVSRSDRGYGFPPMFGRNSTIVAAVDSTESHLEDVVSFFERTYKKPL